MWYVDKMANLFERIVKEKDWFLLDLTCAFNATQQDM